MAGKEQKLEPTWAAKLMTKLTWRNPRRLLIQCTWDALNMNVRRTVVSLKSTERCLNHEFPREQPKSGQIPETYGRVTAWSFDMVGHAQKCVDRYCGWSNKNLEQLHKACTLCVDDHKFKKLEPETVGEFPKLCSQIS